VTRFLIAYGHKSKCVFKAVIFLLTSFFFLSCIDNEQIQWITMKGEVEQLRPAPKSGSYLYSHTGKLLFSSDPIYPVYVFIESSDRDKQKEQVFAWIKMESGDSYTINAELDPGTYYIRSGFSEDNEACCSADRKYWGAFGPHIRIKSDGSSKTEHKMLRHQLVMKFVAPLPKETVQSTRPTLKWQPVQEATYYEVGWHCWAEDCPRGSFNLGKRVETTSYTFQKPLPSGFKIHWNVHAFNANNEGIAYYADSSFWTPKEAESDY
jgi:hypothetical protein